MTYPTVDLVQSALAIFLWGCLLLLAGYPVFAGRSCPLAGPGWNIKRIHGAFFFLLFLTLVVWRTPELMFHQQYSVDESQFLATAQRLLMGGIPWRSADAGSSGPLNLYVLTWAPLFGLPFSYFVARLTGIGCIFVTLLFLTLSASIILGRRHALLVVFSAATFYLLAWSRHFVHYSGEHLPEALLSVAVWLLLTLWRKPRWSSALALGILLGALPFSKLQAAPVGAYFFGIALVLIFFREKGRLIGRTDRRRFMGALVAGMVLVPLALLLPVTAAGAWPDFVRRYLLGNLGYGRQMIYLHPQPLWLLVLGFIDAIKAFFLGLAGLSAILIVIKLINCSPRRDRTWLVGLVFAGGYLVVTIALILKTGMPFIHYLLLLPVPLVVLAAWSMRGILRAHPRFVFAQGRLALPLLFVFTCILPQTITYPRYFRERPQLSDRPASDPVIPAIKALSHSGDALAVWGWAPEYFIQTGLRPATRDLAGLALLAPGKETDFLREAFLSDMEESKPRIFIDATGGGVQAMYPANWPHPVEKARFFMYPALAAYINAHYHLQSQIVSYAGTPPVLLFVRND